MTNTSERGTGLKSGFKRLEALEILPLPICLRNGKPVDVEHTTSEEFTSWLHWTGIPFTGSSEWNFDSKCAIINYALSQGVKPRLIANPGSSLEYLLHLFEVPKPACGAALDVV